MKKIFKWISYAATIDTFVNIKWAWLNFVSLIICIVFSIGNGTWPPIDSFGGVLVLIVFFSNLVYISVFFLLGMIRYLNSKIVK